MADKNIEPKRPEKDEPAAGTRKAERQTTRRMRRQVKRVNKKVAKR